MKPKKTKENYNFNQTQAFNISSIELYRKFSAPNLCPSKRKSKNFGRLNKIIKSAKLDSSNTIDIDSLNKKLLNIHNNTLKNVKASSSGLNGNFRRKINIKNNTKFFNYFHDNEKSDMNNRNKVNTNITNNINQTVEHKLLYEDIIKLKSKINKLKMELSFLKGLNRKKDEEIKELEKYQEEVKYYSDKKENNAFYKKLEISQEIIKLKNKYESIRIEYAKQKDINQNLIKKIKYIDISAINKEINELKKILISKVEEFKILKKENDELEKKLSNSDWIKNKYEENHKFISQLKFNISKKLLLIEKKKKILQKLEEKYEKMKNKQNQILRRNSSIINDNKKLLDDKKLIQDNIIRQIEIQKKISAYENKTKDLMNETMNKENIINDYLQLNSTERRINKNKINMVNFKPILEKNPNDFKKSNVILYESLIQESKKRQNELLNNIKELIEESKNEIRNGNNLIIPKKNEVNSNNNSNNIIDEENSQLFSNYDIINSGIRDIDIEDSGEIIKKNNDFIYLLNVLFYIKNISQQKIQNILLNFKTEKYYIGNLNDKKDFLNNLSTEILGTIDNTNDINNMTEILAFLLDNKYQGKNILFLDNVINDIYLLNDNEKIFLNNNDEKIVMEKIRKIFDENNNKLIKEKINKIKNKSNISYEKLKLILNEGKFFKQEKDEEIKLLQFFIYFIKKREKLTQNYSLNKFSINNLMNFMNELNKRVDNNFIENFKNFLENKNVTLEDFLGKKDTINISVFMNILNENEFKIKDINLDIYCELQKYQTKENPTNININKLKKDLYKI